MDKLIVKFTNGEEINITSNNSLINLKDDFTPDVGNMTSLPENPGYLLAEFLIFTEKYDHFYVIDFSKPNYSDLNKKPLYFSGSIVSITLVRDENTYEFD